jgi:hypothetical protein
VAAMPFIPLVSSNAINGTELSPSPNTHSREYGTSAIRIDDDDVLYSNFIAWISAQRVTEVSRDLKAATSTTGRRDDHDEDESDDDDDDVLDESGLFKYEKWSGNSPIRYEPNFGDNHITATTSSSPKKRRRTSTERPGIFTLSFVATGVLRSLSKT